MRVLPAALVLLATAPAAAEPLAITREAAIHDDAAVTVDVAPASLHLSWRLAAALASVTDAADGQAATAGIAGVEAEAALSHGDADLIVLGGQIGLGVDGGDRAGDAPAVTAQQWAQIALFRGDLDYTIGHRLEWDVRPTLLAPPRLRAGLNRRETIAVNIHALSTDLEGVATITPDAPAERLRFGWMDVEVGFEWSAGTPAVLGAASVGAAMGLLGYVRERADGGTPFEIWVAHSDAAMRIEEAADATSVMQIGFDLFRFTGARLGGFRLGARAGIAAHALIRGDGLAAPDAMPSPVDPSDSTDAFSVEPGLSIERDAGAATYRIAAERSHWAHWSGAAIIDDRLTVAVTTPLGPFRARAELFGARSHILATGGAMTTAATGGMSALLETDLGRHAVLRLRTDAGRGIYAPGASLDQPRWAAELLATLSLRAGTR